MRWEGQISCASRKDPSEHKRIRYILHSHKILRFVGKILEIYIFDNISLAKPLLVSVLLLLCNLSHRHGKRQFLSSTLKTVFFLLNL